MSKIFNKHIGLTTLTLALGVLLLVPYQAHAQAAAIAQAVGIMSSVDPSIWVDSILSVFFANVVGWILQFSALLTGIASALLNGVVYYTVVNVQQNYDNLGPILETWKVLRDIANMSFIFVLLYAGIKTILGQGENSKTLIVNVIIAAVLLNFSLFLTRLVIDTSNVLALTFYDAVAPGSLTANGQFNWSGGGLATQFTRALGLQSFYQAGETMNTGSIIVVGIMGTIVLLIAAFTFLATALLFVIRYVVLILVIILSPIFFVASALPKGVGIEDMSKQWKNALFGQAFFAPIYLFLIWISLRVLTGIMEAFGSSGVGIGAGAFQNLASGSSIGEILSANIQGAFLMFINFIIVIVLLIASLTQAKKWADKAGNSMSDLTKWASGKAGDLSFGMSGRFGRGTIGRAGAALSENEGLKTAASKGGVMGIGARLALAGSRKTAEASFDVRGAGAASVLGAAGKAPKGGFAKDIKNKIDAEKKFADSLKPSDLTIAQAERELDNAKKEGVAEQIAAAQARIDKLKGVSEEEARNRKIREIRIEQGVGKKTANRILTEEENEHFLEVERLKREEGLSEKEAKERAKGTGWAPETIKSVSVERKEAYAKQTEEKLPISLTGRIGFIGPVKRERHEEALAIRKSIKEKKPAEKIAEEIEKQAIKSSDEGGGESAAPATPSTPSTPPPPTPPTP